jgi:hypothetical protein
LHFRLHDDRLGHHKSGGDFGCVRAQVIVRGGTEH